MDKVTLHIHFFLNSTLSRRYAFTNSSFSVKITMKLEENSILKEVFEKYFYNRFKSYLGGGDLKR